MFKKFTLTLAALACAGLAAAGCGSSTSGKTAAAASSSPAAPVTTPASPVTPAAMTAQQIAAKLAPLGCTASPDTSTEIGGGIQAKTRLVCTINGETVGIDEYVDQQQVAHNMGLAKTLGCQIAKGMGFTGDQDYVLVGNMMVTAQTAGTSQAMKAAIGPAATISVVHCS